MTDEIDADRTNECHWRWILVQKTFQLGYAENAVAEAEILYQYIINGPAPQKACEDTAE